HAGDHAVQRVASALDYFHGLGATVDAAIEGVGAGHHHRLRACLGNRLLRHGKRSRAQHHRPPAQTDVFHEDSPSAWSGTTAARRVRTPTERGYMRKISHYVIRQPGGSSPVCETALTRPQSMQAYALINYPYGDPAIMRTYAAIGLLLVGYAAAFIYQTRRLGLTVDETSHF